jgi:hypothetical protein
MYVRSTEVSRKERKKERGKGHKDGTKGRRCKKSREKWQTVNIANDATPLLL